MDDGANVDLVDVSPIGSPDHFQVTTKQLCRECVHNDDVTYGTGDVADDPKYYNGSPQRLPPLQRGFRRIKSLTVNTNLSLPFLSSPDYPSAVEGSPPPLSYTSDYFDIDDTGPPPPLEVDENMRLHHYPKLVIYDSDGLDGSHACDPRCNFPAPWDIEEGSDASEPLDSSKGYITFAGESESLPSELEVGFRQFDLAEPNAFILDFPEDVGDLLDYDAVSVDGDSGTIGRPGRSTSMMTSEITVKLSAHTPEGSQSPEYAPDTFPPRTRGPSESSSEDSESFPHLPYPGSDVTDVPANIPLSPLILASDGFPDIISHPHSDPVGARAEGVLADVDWLEGSWEETICGPRLEEDFIEWYRWRGQLAGELDRGLDPRARAHENERTRLDWF